MEGARREDAMVGERCGQKIEKERYEISVIGHEVVQRVLDFSPLVTVYFGNRSGLRTSSDLMQRPRETRPAMSMPSAG